MVKAGAPALASNLGSGSPLVSQYCENEETLLCCAIEAQGHTLQLLEALQVVLPFEQSDDKIRLLLMGLSETAYPTSEATTCSLANVRMLRRESMLRAAKQDCQGDQESATSGSNKRSILRHHARECSCVGAGCGITVDGRRSAEPRAQKPPSLKANPPPSHPSTQSRGGSRGRGKRGGKTQACRR